MIMTHDPGRPEDVTDYPMASMKSVMDLHIDLMKNFKASKFIGINLLTFMLSDSEAREAVSNTENEFGIATTDLIRFGNLGFIEAIERELT